MTRLLIISDMEGVAGLERYEQCISGHPEYPAGVELLCNEINAAAEAAFASGAESVSVIDWHGGGGNLQPEKLSSGIEIVPEDLSIGYDLAIMMGFHPMAGDEAGFISHTMLHGVAVDINGGQVGELAFLGWWLGEHGIPVGFVTGDRAGTAEAERFFPDIATHTVKQAETWSRAACIPAEKTYEVLRSRVSRVFQQPGRWQVHRPAPTLNVRLQFRDEQPMVELLPWLTAGSDGWLSGEVSKARDIIDLLDVIASLTADLHRDKRAERLKQIPGVEEALHELLVENTAWMVERGGWRP